MDVNSMGWLFTFMWLIALFAGAYVYRAISSESERENTGFLFLAVVLGLPALVMMLILNYQINSDIMNAWPSGWILFFMWIFSLIGGGLIRKGEDPELGIFWLGITISIVSLISILILNVSLHS